MVLLGSVCFVPISSHLSETSNGPHSGCSISLLLEVKMIQAHGPNQPVMHIEDTALPLLQARDHGVICYHGISQPILTDTKITTRTLSLHNRGGRY